MSSYKLILVAGFAMFSMFFGSGNLVFPILIGASTQSQFSIAAIGLIITGVIVPFIGLLAMIYKKGDRYLFFDSLGHRTGFLLTLFMLALLGPFAVVPRCIIVAQGGVGLIIPSLSPVIFNAIFCLIILFLTWRRAKIIEIIGSLLTPWLLVGIFAIIIAGIIFEPRDLIPSDFAPAESFSFGLLKGYQTMDLLASFFFSATTVTFIMASIKDLKNKAKIETISLRASLVGATLLAIIYIGFVYLGAKYSADLVNSEPQQLLVVIATKCLGNFAMPISAIIIGLACLTTATILTSLFADFLNEDILKNRIPRSVSLIITISISYVLSLVGFANIATFIAEVLSVAYPALIVYSVAIIIEHKFTVCFSKNIFWIVLTLSFIAWLSKFF